MSILSSTLRSAAAISMALSTFAAVAADKYPAAPVRMLVGTPAGGTTDIVARLIAANMEKTLGGSVVVYNKPGASGLIAADFVGKAGADGYTLLMASSQLAT
jgi:tripartite-type tricarboxylate transporter receptor subunit TctC